MSTDLHLAHACPHITRYERVALEGKRLITPLSPISSLGILEVRRDGIPLDMQGNYREASLISPLVSPYRIKQNNNTLNIEISDGFKIDLVIPPKIYSNEKLVEYLSGKTGSIVAKKHGLGIQFTDNSLGLNFTLKGNVLTALGFDTPKKVAKSKKTSPAWNLIKRNNGYNVIFEKSLSPEGLLDITYTTEKAFCRRCSNTGIENDLRFNEIGEIKRVENFDLLYQNVAKVVLTEIGSNPYHDFYGSNAFKLIGKKINGAVGLSLKESVRRALDLFQRIQQRQHKVQQLSPEERLKSVDSILVQQIENDATALLCSIVVTSASNRPVKINIVFAVPGSTPLNGSLR